MSATPDHSTAPRLSGAGLPTAVVGGSLLVAAGLCVAEGSRLTEPVAVAVLTAAALVTETVSTQVQRRSSLSITAGLLLAAAVLSGPLGALLVGVVATSLTARRGIHPMVRLYNTALVGWLGLAGGLAHDGALKVVSPHLDLPDGLARVLAPVAAASVTMLLVNAGLIALIVRATAQVPLARGLSDFLRHNSLLFLVSIFLGYLVVVLWQGAQVGPLTVVVLAPPLLLAQRALDAVGDRTTRAEEIVSTLVAALDAHRPGATHKARLMRAVAGDLADVRGLSEVQSRDVQRAAALVDLGTVDVHRDARPAAADVADRADAVLRGVAVLAPARDLLTGRSDDGALLGVLDVTRAIVDSVLELDDISPESVRVVLHQVTRDDSLDPTARRAVGLSPGLVDHICALQARRTTAVPA